MKIEQRKIDNRLYEFFFMPPKDALRTMVRIIKIVGEPISTVGDLLGSDTDFTKVRLSDVRIPPTFIHKAVAALVSRLDEDAVMQIVDTVLEPVYVKTESDKGTRPLQFDLDFSGKIGHLFKVLFAALEVNYADFLGGNTGLFGAVVKASQDMRSVQQI